MMYTYMNQKRPTNETTFSQKRPTKENPKRDHRRDSQKRPPKETHKRDPQKRPPKETTEENPKPQKRPEICGGDCACSFFQNTRPNDVHVHESKETYTRDNLQPKETHKQRPPKEAHKRGPQKRPTKETWNLRRRSCLLNLPVYSPDWCFAFARITFACFCC